MNRRTFVATTVAACSVPAIRGGSEPVGSNDSSAAGAGVAFRYGEPADLELRSAPVRWQGGDVHLLRLSEFTMSLVVATNRATAVVKGRLYTFDNVDYAVGIALLTGDGSMLGVATTVCKVPRIWLGVYGMQPVELALDFGISNNFRRASRFMASISDRTVLTPEQWQGR